MAYFIIQVKNRRDDSLTPGLRNEARDALKSVMVLFSIIAIFSRWIPVIFTIGIYNLVAKAKPCLQVSIVMDLAPHSNSSSSLDPSTTTS